VKSLEKDDKEIAKSSDGLYYLPKGNYTVKIVKNRKEVEAKMLVE